MEREDGEAQRAIKAGWRRFAAARTSWGKAGNTNFAGWAKLAQARRVCFHTVSEACTPIKGHADSVDERGVAHHSPKRE